MPVKGSTASPLGHVCARCPSWERSPPGSWTSAGAVSLPARRPGSTRLQPETVSSPSCSVCAQPIIGAVTPYALSRSTGSASLSLVRSRRDGFLRGAVRQAIVPPLCSALFSAGASAQTGCRGSFRGACLGAGLRVCHCRFPPESVFRMLPQACPWVGAKLLFHARRFASMRTDMGISASKAPVRSPYASRRRRANSPAKLGRLSIMVTAAPVFRLGLSLRGALPTVWKPSAARRSFPCFALLFKNCAAKRGGGAAPRQKMRSQHPNCDRTNAPAPSYPLQWSPASVPPMATQNQASRTHRPPGRLCSKNGIRFTASDRNTNNAESARKPSIPTTDARRLERAAARRLCRSPAVFQWPADPGLHGVPRA